LRTEIDNANERIAAARAAGDIALMRTMEEYSDIDDYISLLQSQINEREAELSLINRVKALEEARELFAAREYLLAYSIMYETPTDGFDAQQTLLHTQIFRDSSAAIEAGFFRDGKADYDRRRYADARWHLEQAERYTVPDSPTADQMYFMLGRIAEESNDADLAIYYFEIVVNKYPTSAHTRDATNSLGRLRP